MVEIHFFLIPRIYTVFNKTAVLKLKTFIDYLLFSIDYVPVYHHLLQTKPNFEFDFTF